MANQQSTQTWESPADSPESKSRLREISQTPAQIVALNRVITGQNEAISVTVNSNQTKVQVNQHPYAIVLDVDSTLIHQEVIDLLAQMAGVGELVAQITDQAMQGEIDFADALGRRVALLEGLSASALLDAQVAISIQPGAKELIETLQTLGNYVGLVSGGFVQVIEPLASELNIEFIAANELEVADGTLTGRLTGPVIDRQGKAQALARLAALNDVPMSRTVAIGDGANDIEMLKLAAFGVAFNAKPALRECADATVDSPYLSDCLYLLGT